ncbi:MAG: hypothetical protein KJ606_00545 [Chloroflexi bacterium]|nr:hypothetical protein [Chloroflexota bacterium]
MTQIELAAYIQSHLREVGIDVVLSGGATVSLYSSGRYVSKDLDLINVQFAKRSKIKAAMDEIGFREKGRYFENPDTEYFVEFPKGPLSVGEEPVKEISEIELATGILRVISPTDCVKDRLCAYYFWGDKQGLAQAVLVAQFQMIDIREIERWSKVEGKAREFEVFKSKVG